MLKQMNPAFIFSPAYVMNWGDHIFNVKKINLLHKKLIEENICGKEEFIEPGPVTDSQLLLVHTPRYLQELNDSIGDIYAEIPITVDVLDSLRLITGGGIIAVKEALKRGSAANLLGGFHHAFSDYGEGFCLINDMAVAVRVAQKEGLVKKAVIIDCDLHQGNGTARIFQRDDSVFTFSIHQENNYPDIKMKSDIDIGLEDFTSDEIYLSKIKDVIPKILEENCPDIVLYQAGADPFEGDQLGSLKLTKGGLMERDKIIYENVFSRRIPIAVFTGGGYAQVEDVVDIHFNTLKLLAERGNYEESDFICEKCGETWTDSQAGTTHCCIFKITRKKNARILER